MCTSLGWTGPGYLPTGLTQTKRHYPVLAFLLKLVVTVAVLWCLFLKIPWGGPASELGKVQLAWLIAAVLLIGAGTIGIGLRWWLLLKIQTIAMTARRAVALTFIGQVFNAFLLGFTGGDVVKIVYAVRNAPEKRAAAALTVLLDRVVGLGGLLVYAALVVPMHAASLLGRIETRCLPLVLYALLGAITLGALATGFRPYDRLPGFVKSWAAILRVHTPLVKLQDVVRANFDRPRLFAGILELGSLVPLASFADGFCLARSLDMPVSLAQMAIILPVVFCVISLPVSISGLGVREGMFVLMFGLFRVIDPERQAAVAVIFSLLWFALGLLWSLVNAGIYLCLRTKTDAAGADHPRAPFAAGR